MCDADPDTLQSLLDKSLVRRREERGQTRYWMLETIRELAAERLAAAGEEVDLRRRHAEHYLAVARSANLAADFEGPQRHDLVIPERDNLRAALGWAVESGERELGLELVVALENYWATSLPAEGHEWVSAFLRGGRGLTPTRRARLARPRRHGEQAGAARRIRSELGARADIARPSATTGPSPSCFTGCRTPPCDEATYSVRGARRGEPRGPSARREYPKGESQAVGSLAWVAFPKVTRTGARAASARAVPLQRKPVSTGGLRGCSPTSAPSHSSWEDRGGSGQRAARR